MFFFFVRIGCQPTSFFKEVQCVYRCQYFTDVFVPQPKTVLYQTVLSANGCLQTLICKQPVCVREFVFTNEICLYKRQLRNLPTVFKKKETNEYTNKRTSEQAKKHDLLELYTLRHSDTCTYTQTQTHAVHVINPMCMLYNM